MTTKVNPAVITPTEYAYDVAIGALYTRYNNLPRHTKLDKRIVNAVAKLHNRLLEQSGMDGLSLATIINPLPDNL